MLTPLDNGLQLVLEHFRASLMRAFAFVMPCAWNILHRAFHAVGSLHCAILSLHAVFTSGLFIHTTPHHRAPLVACTAFLLSLFIYLLLCLSPSSRIWHEGAVYTTMSPSSAEHLP